MFNKELKFQENQKERMTSSAAIASATALTNEQIAKIRFDVASSENVNNVSGQYWVRSAFSPLYGIYSQGTVSIDSETNTEFLDEDERGICFIYRNNDNRGAFTDIIIPHIKDIEIIKDNVVIVIFADGSKEKAVLDSADTFSLEHGISICITKKMLSMQTNGNGSSAYNKLIKHCLKLYDNNRKAEEKAKADEQAAKEKEKKAADKARAKRIKKANKNREREIEIQKEAYLRAMREFGGNSAVND